MKSTLLVSFMLLILILSCFQDEPLNEYYQDGSPKVLVNVIDPNKFCFKYYYKNGNLEKKFCTKNEKIDGNYYEYHENGSLSAALSFINNRKEGQGLFYHENKVIKGTNFYKNDLIHGIQKSFNRAGKIQVVNYKQDGVSYYIKQYFYDTNGLLKKEKERFFPKVHFLSDTVLHKKDTFIFTVQLPIPDSFIINNSLEFFFDIAPQCGIDTLYNYPSNSFKILDNKIYRQRSIINTAGACMTFYGVIGQEINEMITFSRPPFKQKLRVVD